MMKRTLKPYTKEQGQIIYNMFYSETPGTREEKITYAESIGRTLTQIGGKASYEKSMKKSPNVTKKYTRKLQKPAQVTVTQVVRPVPTQKEAKITVGDAVVSIPSSTFHVNGVKIDW